MADGIFAGIPVRDYASALKWHPKLLGADPAFFPNDVEAIWQLAEDRYAYIVEFPERAGGAVPLSSSLRTTLAKIGPGMKLKSPRLGSRMTEPVMSAGNFESVGTT